MKKIYLAIISVFLFLNNKCFADIALPEPINRNIYNGNEIYGIQPNEVLAMMIIEAIIFIIIIIAVILLMKSKKNKESK